MQIAGRVETLRRNAQLLVQGTEIGVEGGFDQGEKCCMLLSFTWVG
ncbi:MAG: hypothetical protein ACYCZR_08870 [Burkholderiales bacterium]